MLRGYGATEAEAEGSALGATGGGKVVVSVCAGTVGEPRGRGGVTPRVAPAPPAPPPPPPQQQPQQPPKPAELPKQGPTVTADPGLAGVTFHITDRSGVASQCTYSSEGFQSSFGLPANGSHDLFVPAVRLFKNRTGTVTCDNGTSTNTSVFY